MLTIFKGDDTGGVLGKHIAITIDTELPLTDCSVLFYFHGVVREFKNITSGSQIEVFFSHNDTQSMPIGVGRATLKVRDASGKIRTLTTTLPIDVTNNITKCYGDDAQNATITIRAVVTWDDIIEKPFSGKVVNLRNDNEMLAAVGTIVEELGGTVNA